MMLSKFQIFSIPLKMCLVWKIDTDHKEVKNKLRNVGVLDSFNLIILKCLFTIFLVEVRQNFLLIRIIYINRYN